MQCDLIGSLIHKHHDLYMKLFDKSLKPKHHIMTHYAQIIKKIGPLKHIWSMRLEAFHKVLKNISDATASRKNIALTNAKKNQLMFAFRLLKNGVLLNKSVQGSGVDINILDEKFSELHHLTFEFSHYFSVKHITIWV